VFLSVDEIFLSEVFAAEKLLAKYINFLKSAFALKYEI